MVCLVLPIWMLSRVSGKVRKVEEFCKLQHAKSGKAFRLARNDYPNYGKAVGMDANRWWANQVIHSTFSTLLPDAAPVTKELVASLLCRFSSHEGYRLYDDVRPFFKQLQEWRNASSATRSDLSEIQVGVISNSDDRVPTILDALGICVNSRRFGSKIVESTGYSDIDWVVMSYDVGFEKPHSEIFDAARKVSASSAERQGVCLHVGDSIREDYRGGLEAGWQSVLLDRDNKHEKEIPPAARVTDLISLMTRLKYSQQNAE
ncbi:MAG: hypothetical protein Q9209_005204 [Squamulea sp. 1 TL-2023]